MEQGLTAYHPRVERFESPDRSVPICVILPVDSCIPVAQLRQPHGLGMHAVIVTQPQQRRPSGIIA